MKNNILYLTLAVLLTSCSFNTSSSIASNDSQDSSTSIDISYTFEDKVNKLQSEYSFKTSQFPGDELLDFFDQYDLTRYLLFSELDYNGNIFYRYENENKSLDFAFVYSDYQLLEKAFNDYQIEVVSYGDYFLNETNEEKSVYLSANEALEIVVSKNKETDSLPNYIQMQLNILKTHSAFAEAIIGAVKVDSWPNDYIDTYLAEFNVKTQVKPYTRQAITTYVTYSTVTDVQQTYYGRKTLVVMFKSDVTPFAYLSDLGSLGWFYESLGPSFGYGVAPSPNKDIEIQVTAMDNNDDDGFRYICSMTFIAIN